MGVTIPFDSLVLTASTDEAGHLSDPLFTARVSCLKIKGNGNSYSFPFKLIDQVCDYRLRMVGLVEFQTEAIPPAQPPEGVGTVLHALSDDRVELTFEAPVATRSTPHLISAVIYEPATQQTLTTRFERIEPGSWTPAGTVAIQIGSAKKLIQNQARLQVFFDDQPVVGLTRQF